MAGKEWQQVIKPKWKGTWNLHEAIDGFDADLDFFLLTSSLSGSVGTATESNYCAANGFLDAFAHWRRKQNKPAVSVGLGMISEVGYLHEHPDIEALLLRKGIQPLTETEFLQVIDLALAGVERSPETCVGKDLTPAHILTGLETLGFRRLAELGFDVSFSSSQDPRLAILAAALAAEQSAEEDQSTLTAEQGSWLAAAAAWTKGLPAYALAVLASEGGAASLQAAMLSLIRKRFSSLILTPVDQLDDFKPLARFGVDSMIASEFRSWFWNALKVDIPFLDILSPEKSLNVLAEFATERLSEVQVS
ncbi:hypothetical protein KJ359_009426 [Pestalotiopsis sp. 9143b]|nr:hypothetical protein KJ359_009426 [Pestalotiopsis sp. 9143b]